MLGLKKLTKEEFGKILLPEKIYTLHFKKELENVYSKIYFDNINYTIISNLFLLSTIIALIAYLFTYPYIYSFFYNYFVKGFGWKVAIIFISWFLYSLIFYLGTIFGYFFFIDSKVKKNEVEIEADLPEFIDNLVSNLKGGISLEKALIQSVRKGQDALKAEVTLINEKIMTGKSVTQALYEFRKRYDSPIINRTIFLIEEGVKGGGNLSAPLERISENLKTIYNLDDEIKGNTGGFSVVIRVITLVIAPLLFALAITLLTFIGNLFALISKGNQDGGFSFLSAIGPEYVDYLIVFSYAMLIMITFFSSLITSQLKNEKIYTALKYLPIYILIVIILFNTFTSVLLGFFGNILSF